MVIFNLIGVALLNTDFCRKYEILDAQSIKRVLSSNFLSDSLDHFLISSEMTQYSFNLRLLRDLRNLQANIEAIDEIHFLKNRLHACCSDDHQFATSLWWSLFDQDQ